MDERLLKDILDTLSDIKERLARLEAREPTNPVQCALHNRSLEDYERRIGRLERVAEHDNMLKILLGAFGVALAYGAKGLYGFFFGGQ